MNKLKLILVLVVMMGATACQERYRYHCQDPKNWEKEDCKPPICEATQTCPEYLRKRNHDPK